MANGLLLPTIPFADVAAAATAFGVRAVTCRLCSCVPSVPTTSRAKIIPPLLLELTLLEYENRFLLPAEKSRSSLHGCLF